MLASIYAQLMLLAGSSFSIFEGFRFSLVHPGCAGEACLAPGQFSPSIPCSQDPDGSFDCVRAGILFFGKVWSRFPVFCFGDPSRTVFFSAIFPLHNDKNVERQKKKEVGLL